MQALGRLILPAGSRLLPGGRLLPPALQHSLTAATSQHPAHDLACTTRSISQEAGPCDSLRDAQLHARAPLAPALSHSLPFALRHAQYSTSAASSKDAAQSSSSEDAPASISPLQAALPVVAPAAKRSSQVADEKVATCNYKNVKGGWKKYNLVLDVVRRMQIDDALAQCDLVKKRAAQFVKRALINALSNAIYQKGMDRENLVVDEIYVTKGQYRKKIMVMGRGFAGKMEGKYCHLKVVLREVPERIRYRTVYVDPIMARQRKQRA